MKEIFLAFTFALLSAGTANACPEQKVVLSFSTNGDGTTQIYAISKDHALRLPRWQPNEPEQPLSVSAAFKNAEVALRKQQGSAFSKYKLSDIRMFKKEIDKHDTWLFMFNFINTLTKPRAEGNGFFVADTTYVVVTMDGTALTGERVSEKEFNSLMRGCNAF